MVKETEKLFSHREIAEVIDGALALLPSADAWAKWLDYHDFTGANAKKPGVVRSASGALEEAARTKDPSGRGSYSLCQATFALLSEELRTFPGWSDDAAKEYYWWLPSWIWEPANAASRPRFDLKLFNDDDAIEYEHVIAFLTYVRNLLSWRDQESELWGRNLNPGATVH